MPTYDYECQACGHKFEHFQEMSAKKLRTCPECRKKKLLRLVGAGAGVIFKGSGFYETDYKRAGASTAGNKDEAPSEGTSDTKPDGGKGSSGDSDSKASTSKAGTSKAGTSKASDAKSGSKGSSKGGGSKGTRST